MITRGVNHTVAKKEGLMTQRAVPLTHQRFRSEIEKGTRDFHKYVFASIFFRNAVIAGPGSLDRGLDLWRVKVGGTVDLEGVTIKGDLNLNSAVIKGGLDLNRVTIEGNLFLQCARIGSGIDLRNATIKGDLILDEARVDGSLTLSGATIGGALHFTVFNNAVIKGGLDLTTKQGPVCIYVGKRCAQLVHWAAPSIPLVVDYRL
ncbi:MAG: hypothetical protein A3C82_00185 [Candidatus Wildermuthbacteria bacterium RIFCSPHIGHO2_02_FULL_47_12]|uniref:Uncharacterized protein n=1 Tax=Candidatus Wildermuthbacteria bacterium RIFCSPHIGHO2_02_FULL_47_12 TaxID=1802451 RepID=A0A1G2R3H8_9BACT|nr:MAG: hypothetical protein A3C82_00185 [Candidatus Wildermuthbacteria bacterium RIFCSPHIGHO2_02_FULL_47_12]